MTVLGNVAALQFHFDNIYASAKADIAPAISSLHPRIYRVSDDIMTQPQIVLSYPETNAIARVTD